MLDQLHHATDWTAKTVAGVVPGQLAAPTPCAEWNVRALLDHLIGGTWMFAAAIGGPAGDDPAAPDAERFRAGADALLTTLREPGALDRTAQLPIGPVPGAAMVGVAMLDVVVHGWDIARATGQDTAVPGPLAETVLGFATETVGPDMRGPDGYFAEAVTVADRASSIDRLVAFLGRQP